LIHPWPSNKNKLTLIHLVEWYPARFQKRARRRVPHEDVSDGHVF